MNKKSLKLFSLFALCSLLFAICYLSCEQPFKAGLGPIIDLQDPTIVLESPKAGSTIRKETTFKGRADDDYKLDSIWFTITNYPNVDLPEYKKTTVDGVTYYRIMDVPKDTRTIEWNFKIDTLRLDADGNRVFQDGDLKIRLRVVDSIGKKAITDQIVFRIKNDRPDITINAPQINQGSEDGDLGSDSLNYGRLGGHIVNKASPPAAPVYEYETADDARKVPFKRWMTTKSDITGLISDREGIYQGDASPGFDSSGNPVELFPPQIRFWQVYPPGEIPVDKNGAVIPNTYPDDVIPTLDQVPWRNLTDVGDVMQIGKTDLHISYSLPDISGSYYAFQIRAQSTDAACSTVEYPRDYMNFEDAKERLPDPSFPGFDFENFTKENSYVLVVVREPLEYPVLELYQFQDIYGDRGNDRRANWKLGSNGVDYDDLPEPVNPDKADGNHEYIDTSIVDKKGPFTLRMKASHNSGIDSARVYWEKSDKSKKGRFIWDPPEEPYLNPAWTAGGGTNSMPSKSAHYSKWGINEPGGFAVRSFVFTYTDGNPKGATAANAAFDRLPNDTEFQNNSMGDIRGMSKVQEYTGNKYNPDGKIYDYDELPDARDNWRDIYKLDDGTYNFYVYTTSLSNTRSPTPFVITIRIDRSKPTIELDKIAGSAGEKRNAKNERENTVNGVIQPFFRFNEPQATDTGFREGKTPFFANPAAAGSFYQERAYILIEEKDSVKMDAFINSGKNIWPFNKLDDNKPIIPDVTVQKTGPVVYEGSFRFKTSPIYGDGSGAGSTETDTLADGDYRLYVFARDNAFNVGSVSYPILVRYKSDYPTFDFSIGSVDTTAVREPDSAHDKDGSKYTPADEKSFITSKGKRNMFTANSRIEVRLRDDDSLDLGVNGGAASGVKVTFIGSRPVKVGDELVLKEDDSAYQMPLLDPEVKLAFPPEGEAGERKIVTDVRGNITHEMLLNLLKKNTQYSDRFPSDPTQFAAISTLPDGIYRVGISIRDYPGDNYPANDVKLIMKPPFQTTQDPRLADAVTVDDMPVPPLNADPLVTTKYFWIAVDTNNPEIIITEGTSGNIMPNEKKNLKGDVSDANGPITLVDWRVKNGLSGSAGIESSMTGNPLKPDSPKIITTGDGLGFNYKEYSKGKWVYDFYYLLDMNGRTTGSYEFELTFQDRFGNKTTESRKYSVDNIPPQVSLIKKIETFSRPMLDDSDITAYTSYTDSSDKITLNKERLAVKVVNFAINATDANGVAGVRWWLLPTSIIANNTGFTATASGNGKIESTEPGNPARNSKGYDAFPSTYIGAGIDLTKPGVYYPEINVPGFTAGVYGVMEVTSTTIRRTVALDSRRLPDPNGEYRLYIVAVDSAGNYSEYLDTSITFTNAFQEVFFLQKEDKPYFGEISLGENIGDSRGWPKVDNGAGGLKDKDMPVFGGVPIIRGTVWENNGFFGDDKENDFWPKTGNTGVSGSMGSITIWFNGRTNDELPVGWETTVINGGSLEAYGFYKKDIPIDSKSGLGMQGRNISLAIELPTLFPNEFKTDGHKRYIIKATDSPVNKLKEETYFPATANYTDLDGNGIPMGVSNKTTAVEDRDIREYSYRQYAFVYDAVPPKVVIDTPVKKPVQTYGKTFKDEFILGGYIADANLEVTANGDYYFDYYLNNDAKKTFSLKPMIGVNLNNPILVDNNGAPKSGQPSIPSHLGKDGVTQLPGPADSALVEGQHIYAITKDDNGKITVYFRIKASEVSKETNGIIPESRFTSLGEGTHTLTLWAADKSGKEGVDWVDFIKDMEPPKITFTNLTGNNRPYDSTNESKVDKANAGTVTGWWNKSAAQRQTLALGGNPSPAPLPLTTISYEPGNKPELRGTITDVVSSIKLTTGINADVGTGDINISGSSFKYWIDNELVTKPEGRFLALIDGAGSKSVRWTILLTSDGTKDGTPLYDGIHTIVLTVADTAGEEIQEADRYMIAFRIDSKQPKSAVKVNGLDDSIKVYGNVTYQNPGSTSMFTLDVEGTDANLQKVELRIVNTTTGDKVEPPAFTAQNSMTWTYEPFGTSVESAAEDYVKFKGSYAVPKTMFADSGKYDVIVAAFDSANKKSEEYIFQFTYDKDKPVIEFTNPGDETKTSKADLKPENFIYLAEPSFAPNPPYRPGTTTANPYYDPAKYSDINRLISQNLRIQGNVKDTFSAVRDVQSRVERWNWLTGAWVQVEDWTSLRDYKDNTQLQVAWTKNLLGQTPVDLDLKDHNPQGEGLYRIRIRARDSSYIPTPPPAVNQGTTDWDNPVGSGNAAANGIGNPVFSDYVYFYFDRTNPTLEITSINGSSTSMDIYYSNPGKFTFKGTVTDNNRFAKVEVKFESGTKTITKEAALTRYVFTATPEKPTDPDYNASDPATPTLNVGGKKQSWEAVFDEAGSYPDGKYRVIVTAYDMTGRSTSETKSFILDSTKPTLKFTLPAKVQNKGYGDDSENPKAAPPVANPTLANGFASVIVPGGPTAVITGETGDKPGPGGEPGSESGIDQMWFHLGYIDGITNNTNYPFPTKAAIKTWEDTLITRYAGNVGRVTVASNGTITVGATQTLTQTDLDALSPTVRNAYMTKLADYRAASDNDTVGNAWFKLGGTLKPTGFVINNPNIYDWRMEIPAQLDAIPSTDPNYDDHYNTMVDGKRISEGGQIEGLKLYGNTIMIKGRNYYVNPTGTNPIRQMVRAVEGQPGGVYRLPLWVRLTDVAGNVEYYCHDIWIDTNGSIPTTTIESPNNGTQYNARGGTISVDGVARSNTSVYDVIFRVFADGVPDTNLDGIQTNGRPDNTNKTIGANGLADRPIAANLVKINGYNAAEAATVNKLPSDYQNTAWQRANLTLNGGSGEPIIPWSIMLNSEDQIRNLISSQGFASAGTTRDMIRVWLEVFVFNGEGSPIRSSIYPNDNLGTASYGYTGANGGHLYGTAEGTPGPRPYVRAFYIRTGAAAITHPNVGTWTSDYKAPTPAPTPATFTRDNFTWNGEDAQNQGGGGYKGSGTETRSYRFALSATLDPNPSGTSGSGLGEVAYRIKLDGGSYGAWTTVWKSGDAAYPTLPENVNSNGVRITRRDATGNRVRYYFDYAFNSKSAAPPAESGTVFAPVNGGNWANTGGTITVQVRMKDNSPQPNEAEQTIQVAVDNFTPLADAAYRTNSKVAGTNVNFMGRVYDYANPVLPLPTLPTATLPATTVSDSMNTEYTPRKLERVSVWLTKGTGANLRYINMNEKNTTTATLTGMRSINVSRPENTRTAYVDGGGVNDAVKNITVTNRGNTPSNLDYPGLGGKAAYNADYVRDITQATGQPANKMLWSPVNSANYDVRWTLTLDSTLLPDGELTLHYIVVDTAGNASYYTQTGISVRNNYPEISKVTLYTDNVGIGSAYTAPAEVEYALNDYRSRMFANYTDSDDNKFLKSDGTEDTVPDLENSRRKSDTTGYLNSGFISKNSYIGFKVETLKSTGNRPLTFRLQHVTRERVILTRANLQKLLNNRGTANNINLYTIAWHGNYTPQRWKDIGVPIEKNANPTLGTHFVLSPADDFDISTYADSTAEIWRYVHQAGMTPDVQGTVQSDDTVAVGGAPASFTVKPAFGFSGTDFGSIREYDGSHPDLDDTKPDNPTSVSPVMNNDPAAATANAAPYSPKGTAFFLIRVWDSVDTASTDADKQLNDALVIGMNIYKTDSTPPSARLYDLNPYTETAVIENNLNQTIKDAADPQAIGSNIVRGGLFNAGTANAMVRSGFIDPRDQSKALDPKNGLYDKEGAGRLLINGRQLPDYPLKVSSDTVPTTGTTMDKVSGKVILRGLAWDDQLIYQIKVRINTDERTILQLNPSTAKLEPTAGNTNSAFVVDELHWKIGHTAEWAYIWDTAAAPISNAPMNEVMIQVIVVDYKGSGGTPPGLPSPALPATAPTATAPTPADTDTRFHNRVMVDVVPYITGFERETPKFTTKRSLQGWYSFYQGETNIKVKGYNFGTTTGSMTLNGAAITPTGNTPTERTFSIPANGASGLITLTTSAAAYNNTSTTQGKSWNREYNSYTPGSDLWINRHYAHIWRSLGENASQAEGSGASGTAGAGTVFAQYGNSAGLDSPGMALQYTGDNAGLLHGVWTTYGRESLFYAQNIRTKPQVRNNTGLSNSTAGEGNYNQNSGSLLLIKAGEPYSDSDIDYYNGANNDDYFNNTSVVAAYQRDGEPYLIMKPRLHSVVFNNNNSTDGGGGDSGYYITRQQSPVSTYRWKNTRIKKTAVSTADAHPGKVFVTAYDSTYKRLFFKTVSNAITAGGGSTTNDDNGGTAYYLDGGGTITGGIQGTAAATGGAGNWSALDYTSDGYPVVAYFDEQNQTLRLAYAGNATPAGNNWTRRYVLPDTGAGSELRRGSGSYVSMKIDRSAGANQNRVHLAFYNSTYKAIVYATAPSPSGTFTASVIDRVVEGGQWTDISVDRDGNPWIVYADSSRTGNRDGARVAYRSNNTDTGRFTRTNTDPISGNAITGWEALTMPANYQVNNDRLNIAAWPPTGYTGAAATSPIGGWNAAVGYASDQFRIGYFFKPGVSMGNN
jgi:hypothetical protein